MGLDLGRAWKMTTRMARELVDVARHEAPSVWKNPTVRAPAAKPATLSVATYNVKLGGQDLKGVERALAAKRPDVVCLQEVTPEHARTLAKALGLHVVTSRGQKAVLSRFPVTQARNVDFSQDWSSAMRTAMKGGSTEPLQVRSALVVSVNVGGRTVDVVDTHLALGDVKANARQLDALAALVAQRERLGHSVVLGGDFNSNLALAEPGVADAKGVVATKTDTVAEWTARYGAKGQSTAGNIADADDLAAARRLLGRLDSAWETADRRTVVTSAGTLTPEEALAKLATPGLDAKERTRLLTVLDGISHLGARKRFDHLLVSPDLHVRATEVNQRTKASDHQPVFTELGLG
jgi:endonuclease/exonuclease/phosphatase family metal-dependent hydrolase